MLVNTTIEKLREMKLGVMANHFKAQLSMTDVGTLSFEERFGLLVDAEWANRKSNRLTRLVKSAGFVFPNASVEDIEYHADRGLDQAMMLRLSTCIARQTHE